MVTREIHYQLRYQIQHNYILHVLPLYSSKSVPKCAVLFSSTSTVSTTSFSRSCAASRKTYEMMGGGGVRKGVL